MRRSLSLALAGMLALALVWLAAFRIPATEAVDGWLFGRAQWAFLRAGIYDLGTLLVIPMAMPLYALLAVAAVACAGYRRGYAGALAATVLLVGANTASQVLKLVTAAPRPWSDTSWGGAVIEASWPSGHATAAAALAAVVAATVPARHRKAAMYMLGGWALAVGAAVVWMGWHLPSDTLGAWALVIAVTGLARAVELSQRPGLRRAPKAPPPAR